MALAPWQDFELIEQLNLESSLSTPERQEFPLPVIVLLLLTEVVDYPEELFEVNLQLFSVEDLQHLFIITELVLLVVRLDECDLLRLRVLTFADISLLCEMLR